MLEILSIPRNLIGIGWEDMKNIGIMEISEQGTSRKIGALFYFSTSTRSAIKIYISFAHLSQPVTWLWLLPICQKCVCVCILKGIMWSVINGNLKVG